MARKTANEELRDALIRHQIFLMRYGGSVRNQINGVLARSEGEIKLLIEAMPDSSGMETQREYKRLQSVLKRVQALRHADWREAARVLSREITALAYNEPITLNKLVKTVCPVQVSTTLPSRNLLKNIATARPFQGRILRDWASELESQDLRRIATAVQSGMVAGQHSRDIAASIGVVAGQTSSNVESVVRTAVQHVANASRNEWMRENADILDEEQFVATLDSRTTPQCRAHDGERFEVGRGPKPPLHFNCRSLRIPYFDGVLLGDRPANPTTLKALVEDFSQQEGYGKISKRDDLPRGTKTAFDKWAREVKRELIGPVPAKETYQTWLTKQSTRFQNEVLGKTKAQLFRDGGLKLDKFVNREGRELTLKELARKHAEAFEAAGLDPSEFR